MGPIPARRQIANILSIQLIQLILLILSKKILS